MTLVVVEFVTVDELVDGWLVPKEMVRVLPGSLFEVEAVSKASTSPKKGLAATSDTLVTRVGFGTVSKDRVLETRSGGTCTRSGGTCTCSGGTQWVP